MRERGQMLRIVLENGFVTSTDKQSEKIWMRFVVSLILRFERTTVN